MQEINTIMTDHEARRALGSVTRDFANEIISHSEACDYLTELRAHVLEWLIAGPSRSAWQHLFDGVRRVVDTLEEYRPNQ